MFRFAVLLLLLAACAPEPASPPPADSVVRPPVGVSADTSGALADAADPPEAPGDWLLESVDLGASEAGQAVLVDVRAARHDGYDRVVFEFEAARPAVHVEPAAEPVRACGSGEVVELPGAGSLLVRLTRARAHTEAGEATVDPSRRDLDLPAVRALARTCDFEGEVSWAIATSGAAAFRVTTLNAPARIVVDLRH